MFSIKGIYNHPLTPASGYALANLSLSFRKPAVYNSASPLYSGCHAALVWQIYKLIISKQHRAAHTCLPHHVSIAQGTARAVKNLAQSSCREATVLLVMVHRVPGDMSPSPVCSGAVCYQIHNNPALGKVYERASASPNTNGEGVCVHPRIACGIFHVSGEVGHFDRCCGCQEPSEQQIMREEKQRQDAEGVKADETRLILPAPLLPVQTKGMSAGLPWQNGQQPSAARLV